VAALWASGACAERARKGDSGTTASYSWPVLQRPWNRLLALGLTAAAVLVGATVPGAGNADAAPKQRGARCVKQKPQSFLIRGNYLPRGGMDGGEARRRMAMHERSLRYRTEEYGYVDGYGPRGANPDPVTKFLQSTSFFGLPLQVHRRIVPALRCAEADLRKTCRRTPYEPKAAGGYRDYNSYRHGEVTNHLYGIAIDIDPQDNPCCACVAPWPDNPRCKGPARSVYDRMAMPECWVKTFERNGFYWLGHDVLQDTMHFEFLGNPDKYSR